VKCLGCEHCVPSDDPHTLALLRLMEDISEYHYCAGWLMGLERDLFRIAFCAADPSYGMDEISAGRLAELRRLAEVSESWWVWDDADPDIKRITLDEARSRYSK
jgi:hypothetical protein